MSDPGRPGGRRDRPALVQALAGSLALMLAIGAGTAARAAPDGEYRQWRPDDWKWSFSLGASLVAPRMNRMNDALQSDGIRLMDDVFQSFGINSSERVRGFRKLGNAFGGQLSVLHEFEDELRGGLHVGAYHLAGSGAVPLSDLTVVSTTPIVATSSTDYTATHTTVIPYLTVAASIQKVFRFEREPRLQLTIGGWGAVGLLVGAGTRGTITQDVPSGPDLTREFDGIFRGSGWGGGGAGGLEYLLTRKVMVFLETGFDFFRVDEVEVEATVDGSPIATSMLRTIDNVPIPLDYSGFFIRVGLRQAIGVAPGF